MADFGSPVGNTGTYNPNQGLTNLSTLMGIKNAQAQNRNLQAELPSIQAQSQQAQQQNQELSALHNFTIQALNDPSYKNTDGSANVPKFQQDAMKVAPVYGQAYIGQASSNFNEGVQNRQSILDLSNKQKQTIGEYFSAVAAKPNATKADFLDAIEQAREQSNDPMYQRTVDSMLLHFPSLTGTDLAKDSSTIQQFARGTAIAFNSPGVSQSDPSTQAVQGPKGIQYVQTNPQAVGGVKPTGAPIKQGIAPQIVTQPGTGAPNIVGPNGTAQPITSAQPQQPGQQNWWNPAPGQVPYLNAQVQGVSERTQNAIKDANSSPQAIDALNRINSIIDQGTLTGTAFPALKDLKNLAASLGMDTKNADNASELAKNIARFEAARAGMVGNTDASRSLVEAGSPNYKMDATAVKAVAQQSLANEQYIQMYSKLMFTAPDPQTAIQREQQFRSVPNLIQVIELGQMKSAKEVDAFMKRYGLTGADVQKSRQQLQSLGVM